MPRAIAAFAYVVLILGLFWLDRDKKNRTSIALWLPVIWFLLSGSRSVGQWMGSFGSGGISVDAPIALTEGSPIDRAVYAILEAIGIGVLIPRGGKLSRFLR